MMNVTMAQARLKSRVEHLCSWTIHEPSATDLSSNPVDETTADAACVYMFLKLVDYDIDGNYFLACWKSSKAVYEIWQHAQDLSFDVIAAYFKGRNVEILEPVVDLFPKHVQIASTL